MNELTHLDDQGVARMVDVSGKKLQHRLARAEGAIELSPETCALVRDDRLAKGSVLTVAQIAGIQAAKRTGELIPLCHPLALDHVAVTLELTAAGVIARSEVSCTGRTGVEMEALTAVSIALLTVYDMCKAVDKQMRIGPIVLVEKVNPMSSRDAADPQMQTLACHVITLSDRAAAGRYADRSGPRVRELVEAFFADRPIHLTITNCLLPDDPEQLCQEVLRAKQSGVDLLITTGGTGVGPRDITPETVEPLCDKLIPGIMEHIRTTCGRQNPRARLSRSIAGVSGSMQIYCLPGSVRAVEEYMPTILETVEHLHEMLHERDVHG